MSDEQLVAMFQNGDKQAGEQLLIKYKNNVLKVARRFFLSGGETEDLVQEGMCGLYSAMTTYERKDADFSTYAYSCIKNRILDAVKASSASKSLALNNFLPLADLGETLYSGECSPEEQLINNESLSEFSQMLKQNLSTFEYKVMTMYIQGVSMSEISSSLNKSYKSIDNAITRSKRKLHNILIGEN